MKWRPQSVSESEIRHGVYLQHDFQFSHFPAGKTKVMGTIVTERKINNFLNLIEWK